MYMYNTGDTNKYAELHLHLTITDIPQVRSSRKAFKC